MTGSVRSLSVGDHLRLWRQRRRLSQLDLACDADISTKHLSFLETGRSQPSRDMVLHLADRLEIPLRDRNLVLVAAGYAPVFPERPLGDPALGAARKAVDLVLAGHGPIRRSPSTATGTCSRPTRWSGGSWPVPMRHC
ncbi:MAG TPA: helix-turn-helix transcriptional regulator [Stellaceae bacterium]|nr:helix-turn-helix transcriptional regulator [Stellaceae bacterium]